VQRGAVEPAVAAESSVQRVWAWKRDLFVCLSIRLCGRKCVNKYLYLYLDPVSSSANEKTDKRGPTSPRQDMTSYNTNMAMVDSRHRLRCRIDKQTTDRQTDRQMG